VGGGTGGGALLAAVTTRVGGLTGAGTVSGTNVINTRMGTSVADLVAEGGVEAGTISTETAGAISAGATIASKIAVPVAAVSAALEEAILLDCRALSLGIPEDTFWQRSSGIVPVPGTPWSVLSVALPDSSAAIVV
jgi:hypothetical protein